MKQSWTQGLEKDIAEEIRGDFKSSRLVRNRLKELITNKIDTNRLNAIMKDGYDSPSWAFRQADAVGYERALVELISLIEDVDE